MGEIETHENDSSSMKIAAMTWTLLTRSPYLEGGLLRCPSWFQIDLNPIRVLDLLWKNDQIQIIIVPGSAIAYYVLVCTLANWFSFDGVKRISHNMIMTLMHCLTWNFSTFHPNLVDCAVSIVIFSDSQSSSRLYLYSTQAVQWRPSDIHTQTHMVALQESWRIEWE